MGAATSWTRGLLAYSATELQLPSPTPLPVGVTFMLYSPSLHSVAIVALISFSANVDSKFHLTANAISWPHFMKKKHFSALVVLCCNWIKLCHNDMAHCWDVLAVNKGGRLCDVWLQRNATQCKQSSAVHCAPWAIHRHICTIGFNPHLHGRTSLAFI